MRRIIATIVLVLLLSGGLTYVANQMHRQDAAPRPVVQSATFNKNQRSLSNPKSLWVIVNKKRPLMPKDYVPADLVTPKVPQRVPGNESMQLRREASMALETMFASARADGTNLMLSSGYRSYSFQASLYGSYVSSEGNVEADKVSARPGYSEHQTGLAIDVEPENQQCDIDQCFADLPAGRWVAVHAGDYGFILRYPKNKTNVTGYEYEPWHLRYVGNQLVAEMKRTRTETLEEFFDLPSAPSY